MKVVWCTVEELPYSYKFSRGQNFVQICAETSKCIRTKNFNIKIVHSCPYFRVSRVFRVYLPWVRKIKSARRFSISRVRENLFTRKFSDFVQPENSIVRIYTRVAKYSQLHWHAEKILKHHCVSFITYTFLTFLIFNAVIWK